MSKIRTLPGTPGSDRDPGTPVLSTCGTCGLSWNDSIVTTWTPVPSGRCPFEYYHEYEGGEPVTLETGDIPKDFEVNPIRVGIDD